MEDLNNLKNQSQWSGRRVVLFYWLAIAFCGTGVAIGLATQVINPQYDGLQASGQTDHSGFDVMDPTTCTMCHGSVVTAWSASGHALISGSNDTHVWFGTHEYEWAEFQTRDCFMCKTTGWVNNTATGGNVTYDALGVVCGACHSVGGVIPFSNDSCINCHADEGHHGPYYGDFMLSGHSTSLPGLLTSDHAMDSCLHCMSGQGLYAGTGQYGPQLSDITLDNVDALTSIDCATCHDPHGNSYGANLRNETAQELCGTCHGGGGHHWEYELMTAAGNPHGDNNCTDCHGYQLVWRLSRGNWVSGMNHTWAIDGLNGCNVTGCHDGAGEVETAWDTMEEMQTNFTTLLTAYEDLLAEAEDLADDADATEGVDAAKVEAAYDLIADAEHIAEIATADNSGGFHNNALVKQKLVEATAKLNEAKIKAQDAIDTASTEEDSPGFELVGLLLTLSLISCVVIYKRKKT